MTALDPSWAATVLACACAVLVVSPSALPRRSIVLPLAMAACFALYQVLTRPLRDETTAARFLFLLALDHALDAASVTRLAPFALAQPIWGVVVETRWPGDGCRSRS
jgi:drug/metabolite transporter (DMT)-like permease